MALQKKTAPPPAEGANFGSAEFYQKGFTIPEGDYALMFTIQMFAGFKSKPGDSERLGCMVDFHNLKTPGEDPRQAFLSFGTDAHLSWAPNPETGKGIVAIPGGPGKPLADSTNWGIFRRSLDSSGLPPGIFTNDISVLDGVHAHIMSVPEPEERKGFAKKSATSDVAQPEQERRGGNIPTVTEFLEDGKPWEGGGGIPEVGDKPAPTKTATKPGPKQAPKPAAKVVEPEPVAEGGDEAELHDAAIAGLSAYLEKNAKGGTKIACRMESFKHLKAVYDDSVAQAIQDGMYMDDGVLGSLLGELGYKLAGPLVKPS